MAAPTGGLTIVAKSNRHRDYESRDLVAGIEKLLRDKAYKDDELFPFIAAWMRDLRAWGQDVRDDIIRLESAVGVAPGEPGDPPPAPRK